MPDGSINWTGIRRIGDPKIATIIAVVAEEFDMTVQDMLTPRRTKERSRARFFAAWLSRHLTRQSYPAIASRLNLGHHVSALYGKQQVDAWIAEDATLKDRLEQLAEECRRRTT